MYCTVLYSTVLYTKCVQPFLLQRQTDIGMLRPRRGMAASASMRDRQDLSDDPERDSQPPLVVGAVGARSGDDVNNKHTSIRVV